MPSRPVKVIYLLGAARSGTSLLTSLLGEIDGVFAAAEMRLLWKGFDSRRCGCGLAVSECPYWSAAAESGRAAAGFDSPAQFSGLQLAAARNRHLPKLLVGGTAGDAATYLSTMESMYLRLAECSGSGIVVDSSKSAAEAALLRNSERLVTYPVHVVRDPRAVAYSWDRAGRRRPKNRKSTVEAAAAWVASNSAAEVAMSRFRPEGRLSVRYEDFVTQPGSTLARVARLVGITVGTLDFLRGGDSRPRASRHMVGGNALRFEEAVVKLDPDTEWLHRMPPARSALVTAITLPMLARYGYPIRPYWDPSVSSPEPRSSAEEPNPS